MFIIGSSLALPISRRMQDMKRKMLVATVVTLIIVAATPLAQAQKRGRMMSNYDPKTEVTIQGTVEKVDRLTYGNMRGAGLHLVVRSGNEVTEVHLGPAAFVEKEMTFKQ